MATSNNFQYISHTPNDIIGSNEAINNPPYASFVKSKPIVSYPKLKGGIFSIKDNGEFRDGIYLETIMQINFIDFGTLENFGFNDSSDIVNENNRISTDISNFSDFTKNLNDTFKFFYEEINTLYKVLKKEKI